MPGSSSTSFIPKRNPTRKDRQGVQRKVFVGTFVIRIIFFATLLSAGGIYAYEAKLTNDLEKEIVDFNSAISKFDVEKMNKVLETDLRLSQANNRLLYSASIASLLTAFEASTAAASQVKQFSLERVNDTTFVVEADIKTGTFDSVMFQRSAFNNSDTLAVSEIKDLDLKNVPPKSPLYQESESSGEGEVSVSFKTILSVNPDNIHHIPAPVSQNSNPIQTQPIIESASTTNSASTSAVVNEIEI